MSLVGVSLEKQAGCRTVGPDGDQVTARRSCRITGPLHDHETPIGRQPDEPLGRVCMDDPDASAISRHEGEVKGSIPLAKPTQDFFAIR